MRGIRSYIIALLLAFCFDVLAQTIQRSRILGINVPDFVDTFYTTNQSPEQALTSPNSEFKPKSDFTSFLPILDNNLLDDNLLASMFRIAGRGISCTNTREYFVWGKDYETGISVVANTLRSSGFDYQEIHREQTSIYGAEQWIWFLVGGRDTRVLGVWLVLDGGERTATYLGWCIRKS